MLRRWLKRGKGKGEKETKMLLNEKRVEQIKKDLEEVDALKEALGMEKRNPPDAASFSMLLVMRLGDLTSRLEDKIGGLSGKLWFLLGVGTISTALLITILTCVLGSGG